MRQETNNGSGNFTTNRGGRPAKLNEKFLEAFQEVIFGKDKQGGIIVKAAVLLEDKEIVEFVNARLPYPDRVAYDSFLSWKVDAKRFNNGDDPDVPDKALIDDVTFARFYQLYRAALIAYKIKLLESVAEAYDPSWRSRSWILERKFREWSISEEDIGDKEALNVKRFIFKEASGVLEE